MNRGTARLNLPGGTTDQFAFLSLSDGGGSTFVGLNAGNKFPGSLNTFVGAGSGTYSESVSTSVYLGSLAGESSDRAGDTVAVGHGAARYARDSYSNVLVGTSAGESLRRADLNTAIGHRAMGSAATGRRNVAVGALSGLNARQFANSVCIGYSSGAQTCGGENVFVGGFSGRDANVQNTTLMGYNTGTVLRGANVVAFGAECAAHAADVVDVVIGGYSAGANMANVSTSLVLGAAAGESMTDCAHNVVAGYAAARELVNSEYNTIIGSECAANAESRYTTVVGSKSMNRRNGGRVEFSNCVIVGENISFDLPTQFKTLTYADIRSGYTNGTFNESTRYFPDPFVQLAPASGTVSLGSGYVSWELNETRNDPLPDDQRDLTIFHCLEVTTDGIWYVSWNAASAVDWLGSGYILRFQITTTTKPAARTMTMTVMVDSQTVATRSVSVPALGKSETKLFMDIEIHQFPEPQGTRVAYSFNTASAGEFTFTQYAATHTSRSYVRTSATSANNASKGVYSLITYAARRDAEYVVGTIATDAPHSVRGYGIAANVDTTVSGVAELALVAPATHAGYTAVDYAVPVGTAAEDIACDFLIPGQPGAFGIEWPGGYVAITRDAAGLTLEAYSGDSLVLRAAPDQVYAEGGSITGDGLPLRLPAGGVEYWMTLRVSRTGVGVDVRGYAAGVYRAGGLPSATLTWEFAIALASTTSGGAVTVYADSQNPVVARGVAFTTVALRTAPAYANCVFLGSSFTVENDTADTLVINLGQDTNILRATKEACTITSARTRVSGALAVGDSASHNHIEFRGLYRDGYEVDMPSCFMGERVYEPDTERTEPAPVKGEDASAPLGPDRIRMLSSEFRVDTFLNEYARDTFSNVANAQTATVLTASADGVYVNTLLSTKQTTETVVSITGASGVVTHDFSQGASWYHTGFTDFVCNITNVPLVNGRASTVTLMLQQAATPYTVTGVSVNSAATSIAWLNGSVPTGTAAATDIITLTLLRMGDAWKVFGRAASQL